MNRSLTRLGLAAALCSSLFLTGCDDDDDTPSSPSTPAPVEPSPTPTPSAEPSPSPSPDDTRPQVGERVSFLGRLKTNTPPLLRIGGQDVMVDENTTYDRAGVPITLDQFQINEIVRVRGIVQDDRVTVLATRINVPAPSEDDTNQ
jgi:hypothetical protein